MAYGDGGARSLRDAVSAEQCCILAELLHFPHPSNLGKYTFREALARLPAAHRARWLALSATLSEDTVGASSAVKLLDAHLSECEKFYTSSDQMNDISDPHALLALQEVYLAAITTLLRADRSRKRETNAFDSGSGLPLSEGAMVYLKRILLLSKDLQEGNPLSHVEASGSVGVARMGTEAYSLRASGSL